ncbi:AAA family ATPase [Vagococcus martis]|uniref:AAA family ATPase n=1 Tax=Vagococcus martis TaxID=1768210 RepID=A0A1V4DF45_9ENTE|nr:MoxR family ATPase [Vagococcus martis]OPF86956.1 AAA family ATPase [Vagococcus martis]
MQESVEKINLIINEVKKVVLGKDDVVKLTLTCLLSGGHALFEDVPGTGKTMLVKTLAKTIQTDFSRIQATPDLLPSDILGVSIFDVTEQRFVFHPGPIFTTICLVDEINRTTPKTQAALLEAMAEKRVTIDNDTYQLPDSFFVLATQNPIDYEGTYHLPEAQLDRFMMKLQIGYPSFNDELSLIMGSDRSLINVQPVINLEDIAILKEMASNVVITESIASYALELVTATRKHPAIELGISPRGSEDFIKSAKAFALINGRDFVLPDDLQYLFPYIASHRLKFKHLGTKKQENILQEILEKIDIPVKR